MAYVNKVMMIGRVITDIKHIQFVNKNYISEFRIVVETTKMNEDKQYIRYTHFFDVYTSGKYALKVYNTMKKGYTIHIEGELNYDAYTDKDGRKRSAVKIYAQRITYLQVNDKPNVNTAIEYEVPGNAFTSPQP